MKGRRMIYTDAKGRAWPCEVTGGPYDGGRMAYVRFDARGQGNIPIERLTEVAGPAREPVSAPGVY